jgi:hypothetical protein
MEKSTVREAWDICTVEELDNFNACRIGPAVFKPKWGSDFIFEERGKDCELWNSIQDMDNVSFMMEPMDGYLRRIEEKASRFSAGRMSSCKVYVYNDDIRGEISFRSYSDFVKIGPHDTDSSFEVFKYFINEFESKVCKLELLGGLEEIDIE